MKQSRLQLQWRKGREGKGSDHGSHPRENKHRKSTGATKSATVGRGGEACAVSTGRNFGFFWCCDIHEKCCRVQGVEVRYQGKREEIEVETQHITQVSKPQFISHGRSKFSRCSLNLSRSASEDRRRANERARVDNRQLSSLCLSSDGGGRNKRGLNQMFVLFIQVAH